ncbi:MAG: DUF898 family protein [Pseudomonadota bacterium]
MPFTDGSHQGSGPNQSSRHPLRSDPVVAAAGGGSSGGQAPAQNLLYQGEGRPIAGIAVKNALLTLATLGVYRFWGKTRLRRYLWSKVSYDGEAFEYSGTGKELFLGFLIALAVLVPLFLISLAAEQFVFPGIFSDDPEAQQDSFLWFGIYQAIYVTIIFYLIHFAVYRARRYRLTRTRWRGIRAGQSGTGRGYAWRAMLYGLVSVITLFLAHPWSRNRLQRYMVENTWLGNQAMTYQGKTSDLMAPWLVVWVVNAMFWAVLVFYFPASFYFAGDGLEVNPAAAVGLGIFLMAIWLVVPVYFISLMWYKVREFRYFASVTKFRSLWFESGLTFGRVFWIYVLFVILTMAVFIVMGIVVAVLFAGSVDWQALQNLDNLQDDAVVWTIQIAYLVFLLLVMLVLSVLRIVFLTHPLAHAAINSLTVHGSEDFDVIRQNQDAGPRRGEGFADVLDVGEVGF